MAGLAVPDERPLGLFQGLGGVLAPLAGSCPGLLGEAPEPLMGGVESGALRPGLGGDKDKNGYAEQSRHRSEFSLETAAGEGTLGLAGAR